MPNFLFQIRGSKRILLFPPSDVLSLDLVHGQSGSQIDVFAPGAFEKQPLISTQPHEVILKPGEVLFVPPLWCHAVHPLDGLNVAVNVFFKADTGAYAKGKDIYGNHDIEAYEQARQKLREIEQIFARVPSEMGDFYKLRIGQEFQKITDQIQEQWDGDKR